MKAPLFIALFVSSSLTAQNVLIENSFGTDGYAVTASTSEINKMVFTPDGSIISAGYNIVPGTGAYHLTLTKHYADGTINDDFGVSGIVEHEIEYSSQPFALQLLEDGKILVAGFVYLGPTQSGPGDFLAFVSKFKSNGELDSSFATNGTFILNQSDSHFNDFFVADNGSILLSGNKFDGAILYQLNADGTTDTNYGTNGMKILSPQGFRFINFAAVKSQDGNLISVGLDASDVDNTNLACMKIDLDGNLIQTFGEDGLFIYDYYSGLPEVTEIISDVAERPDGKIVLSGNVTQRMVALLNSDGSLDTSFGTNGFVLHDYANSDLLVQEDNKILLGGNKEMWEYNYGIDITRLDSNGELDPTFNYSGNYELDLCEEGDYLQTFELVNNTYLMIGGSTRMNNSNADFLLAKLDISETLSLNESLEPKVTVYPNPAFDQLFIEGASPEKVQVLNSFGQIITETNYSIESGITISSLAAGSYFLSFETEQGIRTKPFVVF